MASFVYLRPRMTTAMVVTLLLAAARGGDSNLALNNVGSGGMGYISGAAIKGPVGHATMTAYTISAGQTGVQIGTTTTDGSGNFNLQIASYTGPVLLQMSGGSYTDEATGAAMAMAAGDVLTAVVPSVAAGTTVSGVQVTPLTAMAQTMAQHMTGGLTDANIVAANTAIGNNFSVGDILHVQPMNPLVAGSGVGASQDAQNYGMTLAAMSQSAQTLGLSSSSSMVTAMMNDASDGVLDGKSGTSPISMAIGGMMGTSSLAASAGSSSLASAMSSFMGSVQNVSGLTAANMTTLMQKLVNSSGQI